MNKIIMYVIVVLLVFSIASPVYAVNAIDWMLYKKVVLIANGRTVLVNRITGEVKYIRRKKKWMLLEGQDKAAHQTMYDNQVAPKGRSPK